MARVNHYVPLFDFSTRLFSSFLFCFSCSLVPNKRTLFAVSEVFFEVSSFTRAQEIDILHRTAFNLLFENQIQEGRNKTKAVLYDASWLSCTIPVQCNFFTTFIARGLKLAGKKKAICPFPYISLHVWQELSLNCYGKNLHVPIKICVRLHRNISFHYIKIKPIFVTIILTLANKLSSNLVGGIILG